MKKRLIFILSAFLLAIPLTNKPVVSPTALLHGAAELYEALPPKTRILMNDSLFYMGIFTGVASAYLLIQEVRKDKEERSKALMARNSVCMGASAALCIITRHLGANAMIDYGSGLANEEIEKKKEEIATYVKDRWGNIQDNTPNSVKWTVKKAASWAAWATPNFVKNIATGTPAE